MTHANQSDLFAGDSQGDLFGAPAPKAYVPDPRHVRNRLQALLDQMRMSATWPWPDSIVELHRTKTFEYLCGLLPDGEAAEWRDAIAGEIERLDAPAAAAE